MKIDSTVFQNIKNVACWPVSTLYFCKIAALENASPFLICTSLGQKLWEDRKPKERLESKLKFFNDRRKCNIMQRF
jgi:hypothetical protein